MDELIGKSACEIVGLLKKGDIQASETLDALEARIAKVDGDINALPTLCFERARQNIEDVDFSASTLGGIPVAIKDLEDVAGVRTTYGSTVWAQHVPESSDLLVSQIETNGGVVYAKSNTPEFGSGANTFNEVFGATRNPYDLSLSVGGSSGGAAAALASGCAWLAQGSDLGGSLRTPAAFCGVTSLRPSPGLIATGPGLQPFDVYAQKGPMARDIADLALFSDAMAGLNSRVGLSKPHYPREFQKAAAEARKPIKIAYSSNLGVTETAADIESVCGAAVSKIEQQNIPIEITHPDLSRADAAFDGSRALSYALSYGGDLEQMREQIKPENVWNIEKGIELTRAEIIDSAHAQAEVFNNATAFMQDYDLLLCPATCISPYPVEERFPGYAAGLPYAEYYRWLILAYAITTTTLPVITLPCGMTDAGLPVGIQVIGKPHGERELFAYASYFEQVFDWDPWQIIKG